MINSQTKRAPGGNRISRKEARRRDRAQLRMVMQKSDPWHLIRRRLGHVVVSLLRYALLIALGYLILTPILRMVSTAFKHPSELGSPVSIWVPAEFSIEHVVLALRTINYQRTLPYTLVSVALQVVLQIASAMLAGYSFARLKFKGRGVLFACVILTIVVPAQAISLPQYLNFRYFDIFGIIEAVTGQSLNLLGKQIGLYLLAATGQGLKGGLYIYIFRQGFRALPKELEESAFVDGSGYLRTFFRIVLPNSMSSVLTVAVLAFVWNWNDMYFVNLFGGTQDNMMVRFNAATASMDEAMNTVVRGLGDVAVNFELLIDNPLYQQAVADTMSLFVMLPLIVAYLLIQNKFVQSAERSGIVG